MLFVSVILVLDCHRRHTQHCSHILSAISPASSEPTRYPPPQAPQVAAFVTKIELPYELLPGSKICHGYSKHSLDSFLSFHSIGRDLYNAWGPPHSSSHYLQLVPPLLVLPHREFDSMRRKIATWRSNFVYLPKNSYGTLCSRPIQGHGTGLKYTCLTRSWLQYSLLISEEMVRGEQLYPFSALFPYDNVKEVSHESVNAIELTKVEVRIDLHLNLHQKGNTEAAKHS